MILSVSKIGHLCSPKTLRGARRALVECGVERPRNRRPDSVGIEPDRPRLIIRGNRPKSRSGENVCIGKAVLACLGENGVGPCSWLSKVALMSAQARAA